MLEERQNYLSILSTGNDVIKSSYDEAIKEYAAQKVEKKYTGMSCSSLLKILCYLSGFCGVSGICQLF